MISSGLVLLLFPSPPFLLFSLKLGSYLVMVKVSEERKGWKKGLFVSRSFDLELASLPSFLGLMVMDSWYGKLLVAHSVTVF